ncbi:hypothetical protein HDE_14032 [Halotydeus destructor]|nr:hypothetical protein HDE_14032 [Halotydeus destructor]
MSSFADSSSDEWDDLFERIKTRCEKSAMKRTLKPDLCSQLSKLEINEKNTVSSDDLLKIELISAIKGVFDGQSRKGASVSVSDEENEVILTKTARARILSSSDEASESSQSGRRSHNGYSLTKIPRQNHSQFVTNQA